MFKLLKPVQNDRTIGNGIKIGKLGRGVTDRRPALNQDGTYVMKLKNGQNANVKIVAQRGAVPKAEIQFHGNAILVPVTDVARSIKVDDNTGLPVRA